MLCYIGIGSNLGDRKKNIRDAVERLRQTRDITVKRLSKIYETAPVGGPHQPKYLNGVIEIETEIGARSLLYALQTIETEMGRKRTVRYGPRIIDLDILTYGDTRIDEPDLQVPHPRMGEREFVQIPLREIMTKEERRGMDEGI